MSKNDGIGYILPAEPETSDLNCLLVFYPDRDEYRRALIGSLSYLATWTAWEREPTKSGRVAARLWKEANECTMSNCLKEITAVLAAINGTLQSLAGNGSDDDMSTIINNVCCGCCGQSGGSWQQPPFELPPDYAPPTPPPNDDDNPPPDYYVNDSMCAYAHYIVVKWRNVVIAGCDGSLTLSNLVDTLSETFSDTTSIIQWAVTSFNDLLSYLGVFLVGVVGNGGQAAAEIDSKLMAIKCAILQDASSNQKIANVGVLIDTMALPSIVRAYAKAVFSLLPLGPLQDGYIASGAGGIPEWAYTPGCPECVDSVPDPVASGLFLRDHTPTQGQLWVSTNGVDFLQQTTAIDFYRRYWLKGDVANHLDCMISANQSSNIDVACLVKVTNLNLATITINTLLDETPGTLVLDAGEQGQAITSRIDFQTGIQNAVIRVEVEPIGE